jgi:sugar lactone lactonase YvrE
MHRLVRFKLFSSIGLFTLANLLTGCTLANSGTTSSVVPGVAFHGVVHGGQQPVAGARVYLLAFNPSAYAGPGIVASANNASISLLKPSSTGHATDTIGSYVITDEHGLFNITGDYSCTSGFVQGATTAAQPYSNHQTAGAEQVYLYAFGGSAVDAPTTPNSASGFLSALGPCNGLSTLSSFEVNEITTAATAYAFAGFATDGTHIGSSGSTLAIANLNNAFANVASLVDTTTGGPTPSSASITRPVANLITLADILGACINTTGPTGASSNCNTLLAHTRSAGDTGTAATDTAAAAINLAHNPWPSAAGVTALYGLVSASGAAFAGALSSPPNDFALILQFSQTNGLNQNNAVAIDASGDVWVNNAGSSTPYSVSKFSNAGSGLFYSNYSTLLNPDGIAIDTSGNAWIANQTTHGDVTEFSSTGTGDPGTGTYNGGGINSSYGVAIDASGNAWVANQGDGKVSEFTSNGTPVFANGVFSPDSNQPTGIAIDASGSVWVTNRLGDSVSKFNSSGTAVSGTNGYTGGGLLTSGASGARGIAIDPSGNAWTTNSQASTLSEFTSTGTPLSGTNGYSGGGLNYPYAIAIDSAGQVWLCNNAVSSLSAFTNSGTALSSPTGYTGYAPFTASVPPLNQPEGLAIDGAGNVWVSNNGNSTLSEMIGGAAPVVTPLPANLVSPYGATAVNLP